MPQFSRRSFAASGVVFVLAAACFLSVPWNVHLHGPIFLLVLLVGLGAGLSFACQAALWVIARLRFGPGAK